MTTAEYAEDAESLGNKFSQPSEWLRFSPRSVRMDKGQKVRTTDEGIKDSARHFYDGVVVRSLQGSPQPNQGTKEPHSAKPDVHGGHHRAIIDDMAFPALSAKSADKGGPPVRHLS